MTCIIFVLQLMTCIIFVLQLMTCIIWQPCEVGGQHGVIKFIADSGVKTFRLHVSVFGKSLQAPQVRIFSYRRRKASNG